MYEPYWQLETKPFENTSDGRFYYPSESHQGALLKLRYALQNQRAAALLCGPAGLGKTLLVRTLARQLPETFRPFVHLVFPQLPPDQLLAYLADELSGRAAGDAPTMEQSIRRLETVLRENCQAGRHAVVVVDEAHLLRDSHSLETVRLLFNFEFDARPAFTVLLVAQPSLLPVLARTPELDERLAAKCLLQRFTLEETMSYVSHRLTAAGARRTIFESEAVETLHHLAQGIPRRINRLGDLALVLGFAEESPTIRATHVEAVAEEMLVTVMD